MTSIYLPVITSSWLFALAWHLQMAPVLSRGLTQAFWIPYRISSTSLIVSLSPDTSIPCLYLICISINSKGDRCGWLQPLNAVRLLRTLGNQFLPVFPPSRATVKFGKDQAEQFYPQLCAVILETGLYGFMFYGWRSGWCYIPLQAEFPLVVRLACFVIEVIPSNLVRQVCSAVCSWMPRKTNRLFLKLTLALGTDFV